VFVLLLGNFIDYFVLIDFHLIIFICSELHVSCKTATAKIMQMYIFLKSKVTSTGKTNAKEVSK
jgi:hypothetical protein